jgi:hypothetical protein
MIERMKTNYFGAENVPIGATGRIDAAHRIAAHDGLVIDDDELEDEVRKLDEQNAVDADTITNAFGPEEGAAPEGFNLQ